MAYTDDSMGPRRRALVNGLGGNASGFSALPDDAKSRIGDAVNGMFHGGQFHNTGVSGAMPGGIGVPPIVSDGALFNKGVEAQNRTAGYDIGAWNGLPQAEKDKYVAGGGAPVAPAPAAPDYGKAGQFLPGNGSGYDPTKGLDGGNTGKYKMRNVLSHFDPNKGLTPEVVDALNAQGMGKFRMADGDELVLDNNGADASFGRTRHFDVIPKFDDKGRQHEWGYLQQDKGGVMGGAQAAPQGGNPMFAGSTIGAPLQGDAQANIQNALQGMNAQAQPSRIQQLIAALSGGQQ